MGNVIYSMMVSLDGFIEGPNQELDWAIVDEELHRFINNQQRSVGAHLYGRRMYEIMAAHWPTADKNPASTDFEVEFALIWQKMPKIVFSKTLERVEGNARLVRGNIADEIMKLKAQSDKDLELGGAGIAATFMRLGLIDEYQLFVQPVILGRGTPMFPPLDDSTNLRMVETRAFSSGVVLLRYRQADERYAHFHSNGEPGE